MNPFFAVRIKRWGAVLAFILFDILQIYIVGHITVGESKNILRFQFAWEPEFSLSIGSLVLLLILPFVFSYLSALSIVSRGRGIVQIVGPHSLLHRVRREFHRGNPEALDFKADAVQNLLKEMADGQPIGTFENLNMLLAIGIESERLIEKSGVKSVKRVYMADQNIPNAFSLRVLPLPFIGQDWIIINRNVVDILEIHEISSVIAHEIGHAAYYDSWVNSFLSSPRLIIIFVWSVVFARMAQIIIRSGFDDFSLNRLIAIVLLFILIRLILSIALSMTEFTHRQAELLSDYYAANLVGSDQMVNALLKIGSRAEVLNSIMVEFDWLEKRRRGADIKLIARTVLESLDPMETSIEKAREHSLQSYVAATLSEVFQSLKIQIEREQYQDMVKQAVKNLSNERQKVTSMDGVMLQAGTQRKPEKPEKWSDFDFDGNAFLDKEEIKQLVLKLKNSRTRLFENEILQRFGVLPENKSHPQVSERIIFLYDSMIDKENQS